MAEAQPQIDKSAIRNAATVVLWRDGADGPAVLMGQRGAGAAFMPSKYVFPGGAVDDGDAMVPLANPLSDVCLGRLDQQSTPGLGSALAACAIRELWEETGLVIGAEGAWPGQVPDDWTGFAAAGRLPNAAPFSFVFRAITPPGRPRRFDARFFLANANDVIGDADDFSRASDELSHLHWVPITHARLLNLPFITEVVLAEITALLRSGGAPQSVPFFDNSGDRPMFRRLG
ncbi:NUDIX hydrolase [Defluviimonas sp. WL0002]|uniref:NUDIX hydrolase n=1 Tax=Albidovulum marisflavi TaxID=2984159 RepID=A0ABT2ZCD7_9RHOB|nr:NUDIX hydrolase [Defluviimonas sp. WL0002]MCV2868797.1 NUDIX hydrolase [Defluviimonas sp. WL0002]